MGHLGANMLEVARAAASQERARWSRRRSSHPNECIDELRRGARWHPRRWLELQLHIRCGQSAKVLEEQRGWVAGTGRSSRTLTSGSLFGVGIAPPLEWQAGWPVDALRIGWLCRLALLAHCWEHISGRSMSACRGAHYSRVQPLIQVEYEVGPRIGRSARVFCRSARPTCSLSPRVVSLQKCVWEAVQRGRMSMSPCESDVQAARYTYFLKSEHFTSPRADLRDGF